MRSEHDQPRPRAPETLVAEDHDDPGPSKSHIEREPRGYVGEGLGPEEHYFHAEWWQPASWQPHSPTTVERSGQFR